MWAQVKLGTFFLCPQTGFCIFDSQQTITIFKELGVQIPAFTPSNGIVCRGDFYLAFQWLSVTASIIVGSKRHVFNGLSIVQRNQVVPQLSTNLVVRMLLVISTCLGVVSKLGLRKLLLGSCLLFTNQLPGKWMAGLGKIARNPFVIRDFVFALWAICGQNGTTHLEWRENKRFKGPN